MYLLLSLLHFNLHSFQVVLETFTGLQAYDKDREDKKLVMMGTKILILFNIRLNLWMIK